MSIWIGIILPKSHIKKWILITYWLSIAIPVFATITPSFIFKPLQLIFPFGLPSSCIFYQWIIIIFMLSKQFTKGKWPLPISMFLSLASFAVVFLNMFFSTEEFGPLGMLFVNMFTTPLFLIVPGLLRIPANIEIIHLVKKLQYVIYTCIVFQWIVFTLRTFIR